ncbi:MAG: TetR/AcrR family transcriptional regulator [Lachnospiraceae bacterium]|jgi:TetR/AcrR family transcriptional regulator|nr:TetR/AcrR family transcriptional regulator [Lachnospiraceae bacterium]
MLKKLTEEKLAEVLRAGISEFAEHGFYHASMSVIAGRAGISVGVLYKYYADKEEFFLACLKTCMRDLDQALMDVAEPKDCLMVYADRLIRGLQKYAREQRDCIRLYNRLAAGGVPGGEKLVEKIEGLTARLYTGFIETAKRDGTVRRDIDARLFAFFFDNLLMMMQFSYTCDYYRERFRIYCGKDMPDQDEYVRKELLKFFGSAFTIGQSETAFESGTEEGNL